MKKRSVKSSARRSTKRAAARKASAARRVIRKFADNQRIQVVGKHTRRDNSRYGMAYEQMKRTRTVKAFRDARNNALKKKQMKAKPKDAQELLRAAIADEYIKVVA